MRGRLLGVAGGLVAALALAPPAVALADTTVNFDGFAAGTTITNQYADAGGAGQGVVFGPLPGGTGGFDPVVRTPPAGQAQSGANVADIVTCPTGTTDCEFVTPHTTGTFAVPRARVSVDVGYLGSGNACVVPSDLGCAVVTLIAYDAGGNQIAASSPTLVKQGNGVHTLLSVSTPTPRIVGFQVTARTDSTDYDKSVAIDDLAFDTPSTPPSPDFTLTPQSTFVNVVQGSGITDSIAIGRIGGSTGNVRFTVSGALPTGVHAQLAPNPAGGTSSTLTLAADPTAPPTLGAPGTITVTGTPVTGAAGSTPRRFNVTVGVKQAFDVRVEGSTTIDLASCDPTVPVEVTRDLAYPGPVSLSVTGLPATVQGTFSPPQATFPNGAGAQTISLNLTTPATGQPVLPRTATIHATASGLPERTATFTVGGTCPMQYDARVISMQITQGTQLPVLPQRDPNNPGAPIPYSTIGQAAAPGSMQALAKLAAFKQTIVRVYADLRVGPGGGVQVPAVLNGFSYDTSGNLNSLPGGPILPVSSPPKLVTGSSQLPSDFLQDNYNGVYTFVLPTAWERGKVMLEAQLLPDQSGPVPSWAPCTTPACQIDSKFAISQIPFLYTFGVTIRPVALIQTNPYDATLPDPVSVFRWASVVAPVPLTIEPYAATIDIGDEITNKTGNDAMNGVRDKLWDYVCDNGSPAHGWDVGIEHNDIRSSKSDATCLSILPPGLPHVQFAFVNAPEPLVSVSHELFHLFGRPHASAGCGAALAANGTAEDWPGDQQGFLQSVGLAPVTDPNGFPFTVVPTSDSTPTGQWFDFMSYCEHVSDGQPFDSGQNSWVSVHNWNAILASFGYGPAHDLGRATAHAHATAAAVPSLEVRAMVAPGGQVTIVSVSPVSAPPQPASSTSPYHLVASDAGGHPIASVPMLTSFGHADSHPPAPTLTLDAAVPRADVTSIGVAAGGVTLATRRQSAHRPVVSITGIPSFGARYGVLRWRASDRDHDTLSVEVEYSGNGGRSWKPIWIGPNLGHAQVPARYLFRSTSARIRVIVDDGFQTATALTRRFSSPGGPPADQILSPWPHLRQPNDAPLVLSGQAFDDQSRSLTGRRLRWLLGRHLLGTGARITVSGLPAGTHRIRLLARDRYGRTATAAIVVGLRASKPLFLKLVSPRKLGRAARSARLTVASSLAATLVVRVAGLRPQRFTVGRRPRRLRVQVRRGGTRTTLRLSLGAGGLRRTATVSIDR